MRTFVVQISGSAEFDADDVADAIIDYIQPNRADRVTELTGDQAKAAVAIADEIVGDSR